jgi:hypothetical protein
VYVNGALVHQAVNSSAVTVPLTAITANGPTIGVPERDSALIRA